MFGICFFVSTSCISIKPKNVVTDKIFNYYPVTYLSDGNFDWIYNNDIKVTTLKYAYPENNLVLYAQKIDETSIAGRELVLYFKPYHSGFDPTQNKLEVISCVFSYRTGTGNKTFVTVHWINCVYVCNNKKLKSFLNNVF